MSYCAVEQKAIWYLWGETPICICIIGMVIGGRQQKNTRFLNGYFFVVYEAVCYIFNSQATDASSSSSFSILIRGKSGAPSLTVVSALRPPNL